MTLWYLNRSNGYVETETGKPIKDYNDPKYTPVIDKLYTVVGAHVMMDTQQVFKDFMPAFEKLVQMAQQRKNQPPQLPPEAQVVKDTSMAETQRKTAADQAKQAYDQAKLQFDAQKAQLDSQTKIDIENAKLTHQTIQHATELATPPPPAALAAQPQGAPNGIGQ
jgi:hypothetical protein